MNLKYFYYRTYFEGYEKGQSQALEYKRLDLRQPLKDTEENQKLRKSIEESNEKLLKAKNHHLTQPVKSELFAITNLQMEDVHPLTLEVQNPGLLMGGGYPHEVGYSGEFKLGFHFDHTGGLPLLPGSTVKGTLRSLWPQYEYASTNPLEYWPDKKDPKKAILQHKKAKFILSRLKSVGITIPESVKTPEAVQRFVHRVELVLFEGWNGKTLDGPEPSYLPGCKRTVFFDAFPTSSGSSSVALLGRDALTPHGTDPLKNPIPLPFVKVLPGVRFEFRFRLPDLHIQEDVSLNARQLLKLFEELLERSGIGAKTNVGYGHLAAVSAASEREGEVREPQGKTHRDQDTPPFRDQVPEKPKTPPLLDFKKSLAGKNVIAKVVAVEGNIVRYELENVKDVEGLRELKHASASMLKPGSRYTWRVSEANPVKNILIIRVESFKPLD